MRGRKLGQKKLVRRGIKVGRTAGIKKKNTLREKPRSKRNDWEEGGKAMTCQGEKEGKVGEPTIFA